jgi:hypothetical protein
MYSTVRPLDAGLKSSIACFAQAIEAGPELVL